MSDDLELFQIRCKSNGLFSTGGMNPRFTVLGKAWKRGPLLAHLAQFDPYNIEAYYGGCEVVKFVRRLVASESCEVLDFKYSDGVTVGDMRDARVALISGGRKYPWRREIKAKALEIKRAREDA